ncbi:hypothetical protein AB6D06_22285, partial [Vibrio sp. 10N.239.311.G01]|uniref:hypothetical protein n=1 Tax=Vibrio sp. 10N.239.311.G01 TaxID=3229976 RepID=UPI0035532BB2
ETKKNPLSLATYGFFFKTTNFKPTEPKEELIYMKYTYSNNALQPSQVQLFKAKTTKESYEQPREKSTCTPT